MTAPLPLIVNGVPVGTPQHRFAVVSPRSQVSDFPTWEDLRNHVREQQRDANSELFFCKFFVWVKEWLEVPMPEN